MDKDKIKNTIESTGISSTAKMLGIPTTDLIDLMELDMKTFDDLDFEPHSYLGGVISRLMFDNGYGVSVVKHSYSYGSDQGLYELAVLDSEGNLTYETEITHDVIGYLTPEDVTQLMIEVQSL
jgi:hypothetical protein